MAEEPGIVGWGSQRVREGWHAAPSASEPSRLSWGGAGRGGKGAGRRTAQLEEALSNCA